MSVNLIENPIVTEGGITKNLFAGFEPVEFKFKREDAAINGVDQGISNQILINTTSDLSTYLEVGDSVFVYSEGSNYTYDLVGQVVATTSTTVTITGDYIEAGSGGYINYYRNYYLEVETVNVDNSNIKILPFTLRDDGDSAGNITIDVSIVNDLNIQFFEFLTQELTESRTIFNIKYREVWDDTTGSYTLITSDIILVYATQQPETEEFINQLELPVLYKGYPFGIVLTHSNENSDNTGIDFAYDELDLNQAVIVADNSLGSLLANKEGFLFININKDIVYNADTEYITIKADYGGAKFFSSEFFDPNFFDA